VSNVAASTLLEEILAVVQATQVTVNELVVFVEEIMSSTDPIGTELSAIAASDSAAGASLADMATQLQAIATKLGESSLDAADQQALDAIKTQAAAMASQASTEDTTVRGDAQQPPPTTGS
jgi:hypothetical protein